MKKKLKVLITAGPTREMLDPVRFLSNLSTGEMGFTLAKHVKSKGHDVTLISGPVALTPPKGVNFVSITSASDLQKACQKHFPKNDVLVMTAAVCDFTAANPSRQKIRRLKTKQFLLKQTPDIVAGLARKKGKRLVIGFCLETENWLENAKHKLLRKNLDGIVANFYTSKHVPFGNRKITTAFVAPKGMKMIRNQAKTRVSRDLLAWIEDLRANKAL